MSKIERISRGERKAFKKLKKVEKQIRRAPLRGLQEPENAIDLATRFTRAQSNLSRFSKPAEVSYIDLSGKKPVITKVDLESKYPYEGVLEAVESGNYEPLREHVLWSADFKDQLNISRKDSRIADRLAVIALSLPTEMMQGQEIDPAQAPKS